MKTPDITNMEIHRWFDGEMNERERAAFDAEMQRDPALRADADAMQRLGVLLRDNVPMERAVPNADFFNSRIQEAIAQIQREESPAKATTSSLASWLGWLRSPWAYAAGAVAVLALSAIVLTREETVTNTQVFNHYAPSPDVRVNAYHSNEANATVVMLDGLEEIPSAKEMFFDESSSNSDMKMLRRADGKVLLAVATEAGSSPAFPR